MFTVLLQLAEPRVGCPLEGNCENGKKIHRPRQIYQGETLRPYLPVEDR